MNSRQVTRANVKRHQDKALPRRDGAAKPSHYRENEAKIYGINACRALWQVRPGDLVKVYLTKQRLKENQDLIKFCVSNRKAYKLATEDELERLTESVHHEGICVIAKEPRTPNFEEVLRYLKSRQGGTCLVYLDGVQNPHNVGNILRAGAHFGLPYILTDGAAFKILPPSTRRVSEGGAEFTSVVVLADPTRALKSLKEMGFVLLSTSSHAATDVFRAKIPEKTVFILGSEVHGVSEKIEKLCDARLVISGSGQIESLNVASAFAILAAEHWRRFHG